MEKVRVHPLFVLLCLLTLLYGKGVLLGATAFAVILHECGHYFCAKRRGFSLKQLSLMPYGAVMYAEDGLPDADGLAIAFAGPAVNLLCYLMIVVLWWFVPESHPATEPIALSHLWTGVFNLLPCYPLDGSRMLLSLVKNKARWLSVMRVLGIVLGGACLLLFVIGLFFKPVWYLAAIGVMLLFGAFFDAKKESYRLTASKVFFLNDFSIPVEGKTLYVSAEASVRRLTENLTGEYLYCVCVMKEGKEIARLEGQAIEKLFFADRRGSVYEFLVQNNLVGV